MSLDYDSSAAQCSSLKWGAQRLYDMFFDTVAVLFVQLKGDGEKRGQMRVTAARSFIVDSTQ